MSLRTALQDGRATVGGWCSLPSALGAEIMGRAGFDWVCIDTQHGLIGPQEMIGMLQALTAAGTPSLVRVSGHEPADMMRALDAGADGVIVPLVNSRSDALVAARACKYPPLGQRSWGPTRAALLRPDYGPEESNRRLLCLVQIETTEAVESLDEILDVPGIDGIYVGPADLGISYGFPPEIVAERMQHLAVIDTILQAGRARGLVCGIHAQDPVSAAFWIRKGFGLVALGTDAVMLREQATAELAAVRKGLGDEPAHPLD
jgi:4-hydroxy-2-oxoheptanedioate aldolase